MTFSSSAAFRSSVRSALQASLLRRAFSLAGTGLVALSLSGCQSVTGSPTLSQVRIIDASPDAPGLDIYQGSSILAYNLGLGTITSYVPITPGTYGILADNANTRQQMVSAQGTFQTGNQYTVLIGNYSNQLQELILKDQGTAAPSGQISVRFIDESTRGGNIDLYLIPTGSTILTVKPVLTNVAFNLNTGYFNVPAGTYTLAALPAGTLPTAAGTTLFTSATISYSSGAARTFVLLDQQLVTTPGIQIIIANDFDSAGATS